MSLGILLVQGGGRYYDRGVFDGKRAMCSITVRGPADAYSGIGVYGPIDAILFPMHHGARDAAPAHG